MQKLTRTTFLYEILLCSPEKIESDKLVLHIPTRNIIANAGDVCLTDMSTHAGVTGHVLLALGALYRKVIVCSLYLEFIALACKI